MNLLAQGLALQAASIGKGPLVKESAASTAPNTEPETIKDTGAPVAADHHEPIARVCPSCGRKHFRAVFDLCLSCSHRE